MDEIAVIAGALDAALPSVDEERRVRTRLFAHIEGRRTRRWTTRRRLLVAVAVIAVLASGTALAFGPLGLFRGTPAPDAVKQQIDAIGGAFVPSLPGIERLDVEEKDATGLFVARVDNGKVLVWSAPLKDGGRCLFLQPIGLRHQWMQFGPCEAPRMLQSPIVLAIQGFPEGHYLITGRVSDRVARLVATYRHARPRPVRIVERFFGLQYPFNSFRPLPSGLVAYDSSGRAIARAAVPKVPTQTLFPFGLPSDYAGMKGLLAVDAGAGLPAVVPLRASDRFCRAPGDKKDFCLGLGGNRLGAALGGDYATGYAGSRIAAVRARLADGTTRPVLRLDGRFLYAWAAPRARAVAIVGTDAAGQVVGVLRITPPPSPPPPAKAGRGTGCASCSGMPSTHAPGGAVLTLDRAMGDARLGEQRAGVDRDFGRGRVVSRKANGTRVAYRGGLLVVTYVAGRVDLLETRSTRYRTWTRVGVGTSAAKMHDRISGVRCAPPAGTECRRGRTTFRLDHPDGKVVYIAITTRH